MAVIHLKGDYIGKLTYISQEADNAKFLLFSNGLEIGTISSVKNKQAFPPLFREGFVDIEEDNIEKIFVDGLDTSRRKFLASGLRQFLAYLRSLGLESYEVWIDGSFATKDPIPMDVDIVCFIRRRVLEGLTDEQLKELTRLGTSKGRAYIRERWSCDYYHCPFDSFGERNYWLTKFLSDEYGSAKGIGRIKR